MQLFVCDKCNTVDAVEIAYPQGPLAVPKKEWLCTCCQGKSWHDLFEKEQYRPEMDIVVNRPNGIGLG